MTERLHTDPEQAALPNMELVNYIEGLSVEVLALGRYVVVLSLYTILNSVELRH